MEKSATVKIFFWLVVLTLFTELVFSGSYLFPFITTKSLFFRSLILLGLPFFIFLILKYPQTRPDLKHPVTLAFLAFNLVIVLSWLFGIDRYRSFWGNYERMTGVFESLHLLLLYIYVLTLAKIDRRFVFTLMKAMVWLAGGMALYGILVRFGFHAFYPETFLPRIGGPTGNPVYFGDFFAIPIALALYFAFREGGYKKLLYFTLVILFLAGMYVSGTRGSYVGLIAGVVVAAVVYVFMRFPVLRLKKIYIPAAIVLLLILVLAGSSSLIKNQVKTFTAERDIQSRLIEWKAVWSGFLEYPILGVGPENYHYISDKYYNPERYKYDYSYFDRPHSYPLELLINLGVLGIAAFACLFIVLIVSLAKAFRTSGVSGPGMIALIYGLVAFQAQNFSAFDTLITSLLWVFFMAFITTLSSQYQPVKNWKSSASPMISTSAAVIVCLYLFYVTTFQTAQALTLLKDSAASASINPVASLDFLNQAKDYFVLDKLQVANNYETLSEKIMANIRTEATATEKNPNTLNTVANLNKVIDAGIDYYNATQDNNKLSTVFWYRYAFLYYLRSVVNRQPIDSKAEEFMKKSQELSPNRVEPLLVLYDIRKSQNREADVTDIYNRIMRVVPQDKLNMINAQLGTSTK